MRGDQGRDLAAGAFYRDSEPLSGGLRSPSVLTRSIDSTTACGSLRIRSALSGLWAFSNSSHRGDRRLRVVIDTAHDPVKGGDGNHPRLGQGEEDMTYQYDPNADCAYILINELPHAYSKQIDETRFIDYAADGSVIGIELLYVSSGVDVSGLPYASQVTKILEEHKIKVYA